MNEQEDWLYEDGANANYTVLEEKYANLKKDFEKFESRKKLHENMADQITSVKKSIEMIKTATENLKDEKPFIKEEERQDVIDRAVEFSRWLDGVVEK